LLFEISPLDPITLGGAAILVLITSLAGIIRPAGEAAKVDPARAMKG
jgi:hypothetical protein